MINITTKQCYKLQFLRKNPPVGLSFKVLPNLLPNINSESLIVFNLKHFIHAIISADIRESFNIQAYPTEKIQLSMYLLLMSLPMTDFLEFAESLFKRNVSPYNCFTFLLFHLFK